MRGYDDDELHPAMEDEYGDYEDDGYGQDEEEEEEDEVQETPQPSKEELEYLELRQRLKERFRKKIQKEEGGATRNNSSDRKRKLPNDNFGSFFGPSQPHISQRVIQESKSILETQHLTPKASNSVHPNKKSSGSSTAGSRPGVNNNKSRVINVVKTKVQKLKDTRDYSFLLSDDAQLPAPAKAPLQREVPARSSEARSAQVPVKSKQALGTSGRQVNGIHGEKKSVPMNGHLPSKPGSNKLPSASRPNSSQMDSKKQHSSKNGTGPGRPLAPKGLTAKTPSSLEKKVSPPVAKSSSSSMQKPGMQKPSLQKPSSQKPPSSKLQPSISRQQLEQRREPQGPAKAKVLPKQPAGLSRPQINRPQRPISSHVITHDNRPKKKPVRRYSDDEEDDEGQEAISLIRQMFRYNPNKFADRDDDLSDMEANFDDIMREEKRSARIGREEDEEQLRLLEQEERLLKLKKQKKRKLEQ